MLGWVIVLFTILLIFLCVYVFFYDFFHGRSEKRNFQKKVYRVLKYYAEEEDQLLINKVALVLDEDNRPVSFDHILFADKYVYVFYDFSCFGGLYGNVNDPYIFLRNEKNKVVKITNPVYYNCEKVKKLEEALNISHADRIMVSVVVFNSSLVVPKGIYKKEQTSWFLPLSELEKTIETAEKDDVTPIRHEQSEKLALMLQKRSNQIKKEILLQESLRRKK